MSNEPDKLSRTARYRSGEYGDSLRNKAVYWWTGEFRPPRAGEWYLSGAFIEAWRAPNDLASSYAIAIPVEDRRRGDRRQRRP